MKTKITFLLFILLISFSCTDDKEEFDMSNGLSGVWQLVGFGENNSFGKLTESICDDCYTIGFQGSIITGRTKVNKYTGVYEFSEDNNTISITISGSTYANEFLIDGNDFYSCLSEVSSYSYNKNYLYLFYGDNDNYMKFHFKPALDYTSF